MPTEQQTAATNAPDAAPAAPAAETMLTPSNATEGQAAAPADGQAQPASDKAEPAEKPQGAPEVYADFNAPEGVTFNPEVVDELKAFAKEKNLSQEEAQKLIDLGVKNAQQRDASYRQQIEQAQAQWAEASRTDKEFGGDKLTENLAVAKQALEAFGSKELTDMLNESGLGNHPEIIRAFYRVGKAVSEDRLVKGAAKNAPQDPAKRMFPNMN